MRLDVLLGSARVGTLALEYGDRATFRFASSYLEQADRPVLGRWFEDHLQADWEYASPHSRLPPFFQNYLPEEASALRELIARHAGVKAHRELPLLAVLGEDLPGAIVVRPEGDSVDDHGPPSPPPAAAPAQALHFSLAGMQLKFSVVRHETKFTLPASGLGGHWIVKLPDAVHPEVPRNEHAMLSWARAIGITVPSFEVVAVRDVEGLPRELSFAEADALALRRYDRDGDRRIHQEDFAQVLDVPPGEKYDQGNYATLARITRTICGEADYEELIRRLVFLVLSGNADGHLKNWSLVYPDGKRPRLAPAYDLVATVVYPGIDRTLALKLAGTKRFDEVTLERFETVAIKAGADPVRTRSVAAETAQKARDTFGAVKASLSAASAAALEAHLATIRL